MSRARSLTSLVVSLAALAAAPDARAEHDPLCGAVVTSDLTLTHDIDCIGFTGNAITIDAPGVTFDGAGYRVIAPDSPNAIFVANRNDVTVKNVDVSGWCFGTGIYFQTSTNARIENVRVDSRDFGVRLSTATTPTLIGVTSDGAGQRAVSIEGYVGVPVLADLVLENALVGLFLQAGSATWTLDAGAIDSLAGSHTGIQLDNLSNLTVSGLVLDNPVFGILASAFGSSNLTFRDLTLSGRGSGSANFGGTGLSLSGNGHTLRDVVVNDRAVGVLVQTFTNLTIDGLTALRAGETALSLRGTTLGASNTLTLSRLVLSDSNRGLALQQITGDSAAPLPLTPAIGSLTGNRQGISIAQSRWIDVMGWTPATLQALNMAIWAFDSSNQNLRFQDLDLSNDGTMSTGLESTGLYLAGPNNLVDGVVANGRRRGVEIGHSSLANAVVRNISAVDVETALRITDVALSVSSSLTVENVSCHQCIAALDIQNLDGVAGAPWVIDSSVLSGWSDVYTPIRIRGSSTHLVVRGAAGAPWVLDGVQYGVDAEDGSTNTLTFEHLDVSGPGYGFGISLRGPNHVVRDVIAADRRIGLNAIQASNLTVDQLTVDHASLAGVYFESLTAIPPTLTGLALTNNQRGLWIHSSTPSSPWSVGPAALADVSGSYTAVWLSGASGNIKIEDLVLPTRRGVRVDGVSGAITLEDLVLDGAGIGTGVEASNTPNLVIRRTSASNRATGLAMSNTSNLLLEDVTVRQSRFGLTFGGLAAGGVGPTVSGLVFERNDTAVQLSGSSYTFGPASASAMATTLVVTGSRVGVDLFQNTNLTVRNLRLDAVQTGVSADTRNMSNVTLLGLDVRGGGQGTGIVIGGTNPQVVDCVASDRRTGVYVDRLHQGAVTNLVARRTHIGLHIAGAQTANTATPPTLAGLDVRDSTHGLFLQWLGAAWTLNGAAVGLNAANTQVGILMRDTSNVTFDGFVLPAIAYGISARSNGPPSNITIRNCDLSGSGLGVGLDMNGTNHTLQNVTADQRTTGVDLSSTNGVTVSGLTARHVGSGLVLGSNSGALTLSGLRLEDAAPGLSIGNYSGTLAIDAGEITSLAGSYPAITVTTAPSVTVDAAGLGLTGPTSGSWYTTLPANGGPEAALCGTTLASSVTLSGDLDCSGVTGTALTLGAGVTLDGAGFDVIAPHAATVVRITGAGATVKNLDVSGTRPTGTGVLVNAPGATISDVTAHRRNIGFDLATASQATVTRATATYAQSAAMIIDGLVGLPLAMSQVSLTDSTEGLRFQTTGADADPAGGDLVLDAASLSSLARNGTSLRFTGAARRVVVTGLTLDGYSFGLYGAADDVVIDDVDTSVAAVSGVGVSLAGTSNELSALTTARRIIGYELSGLAGWTVSDLVATDSDGGLRVSGDLAAGAPVFMGLDLRRNQSGLEAYSATGPYTFSGAQFVYPPDFARQNLTDVTLGFASNAITLDDLRVGGLSRGVSVSNGVHTLSRITAICEARGTFGVELNTSNTLSEVLVSGYDRGISAQAPALTASDITVARATFAGVQLTSPAAAVHQISDLTVTDSQVGLYIGAFPSGSPGTDIVGAGSATPAPGRVIVSSFSGNEVDIDLNFATGVTVRDITLSGTTSGLQAFNFNAMNGLVVRNVTSTPPVPGGVGMTIGGNNQVVEGFTASYRDTCLAVSGGTGHDIDDVAVSGCATAGVQIANTTPTASSPLSLDGVTASGVGGGANPAAINLINVNATASPVTLGPAQALSLSDNMTDVRASSTRAVTVTGLVLDGWSAAIAANSSANQGLTFTDLDLRPRMPMGRGLELSGANHLVDGLQASRREYGLMVETGTSGLVARNITADRTQDAAVFYRSVAPPTELGNITARRGQRALRVVNVVGPWTLSPATLGTFDFAGTHNSLNLESVSNVTVEGFALAGYQTGLVLAGAASGMTLRDLTAVPPAPGGTGFTLVGANHVATNLVALRRATGVAIAGATGTTVDGVVVRGANSAMQISSQTGALTLRNLTLEDNHTGFQLNAVVGTPSAHLVFDGATMGAVSLRGTNRGVVLTSSRYVDVKNLDLPGLVEGLVASADTVELGLSGIDGSRGAGAGKLWCVGPNIASSGVSAQGAGHVLSDITVLGRRLGVDFTSAIDMTMDGGLVAANTLAGVYVSGTVTLPDTTVATNAANGTTTFQVASASGLNVPGRRLVIGLGTGPEVRRVASVNGTNLTLDAALPSVPPAGTTVRAWELVNASPRATVTGTDICANRSAGANVSTFATTLLGNYWRTQLGPVHTSNPGGTGDVVTGAGTTVSSFATVPFDVVNPYCNAEPIPDAGPDADVCEGDTVTLDGSASTDPDGEPLTFAWTQTGGTGVAISGAGSATATFIAPAPATVPSEALTFALEVDDNDQRRSDEVVLTTHTRNVAPGADAGADVSADEGDLVSLSGSGSDPEGAGLTFSWVQTGGPAVTLSGASTATPSFEAPAIGSDGGPFSVTVTLELTVTDTVMAGYCGEALSATDTIEIVIDNVNNDPTADAGDDQGVGSGAVVALDGAGSDDPDGDVLSYQWMQTAGPAVTLDDDTIAGPTFTAPTVLSGSETLRFTLTVSDGFGGVDSDEVEIVVSSTCTPTGVAESVCNGVDDDCDELVDEDYTADTSCFLPGACAADNVASSCTLGVETSCRTGTPTAEVCDAIDNDCNGVADDGLTRPTTCGEGACAGNTGTETCTGGAWGGDTCNPLAGAAAEMCDAVDNDCDGDVDEDLTRATTCGEGACAGNTGTETCTGGAWGGDTCDPFAGADAETCDAVDNDCDGDVDEELTRATSCGEGACAGNTGTETCMLGDWTGDTCDPFAGATAEMCDAIDNDCDGDVDEELTRETTCGQGACSTNTGTETCNAGTWGNDTCDPFAGATAEMCDAIDNDCDGDVDEELTRETTCGQGACAANTGTETCNAGTWGNDTCDPFAGATAEACDAIDNDCDGDVDEELTRETTCGQGACAANTGTETCTGGAWGNDTCDPFAGATAEMCDAIDNDCDGDVDEELTRDTTCGQGACAANTGIETCTGGAWGNDTCDPFAGATAEACDAVDNDCDGDVDEELTRETTCGQGACAANTGTETCTGGTWGNDTCDPFAGATAEMCDAVDNDCDGDVDEELTRETTCGQGACAANTGTETCTGGTWGNDTCDPFAGATAELCDAVDNDCDGDVDEDLTRDTTCGQGACSTNTGIETCSAGTWGNDTCDPFAGATAEMCDAVDNDCDGDVDEELTRDTTCGQGACSTNTGIETCTAGTWGNDTCDPFAGATAEACDAVDNDCDGDVDEDLTRDTTCGQGACSTNTGIETCTAGTWGNDTCDPFAGATAEMCDAVDNDCDGDVDENLTRDTTCGQGACSTNTGTETCTAGTWGNDTCDPFAGATAEACDAVDNDCDGDVDEDVASETQSCTLAGGCTGETTLTCVAGEMTAGECTLTEAIVDGCDGIDNDCDAETDEDFVPEIVSCGEDACAAGTGTSTCVDGVLDSTCDPLWTDIPDTTCGAGATGLHVAYIIVTDASGALAGSIRCQQDLADPDTAVTCDVDDLTGRLVVYPELYCEGVAP